MISKLAAACINTTHVTNGEEALAQLGAVEFDFALIDLQQADSDGMALARRIAESQDTATPNIILLIPTGFRRQNSPGLPDCIHTCISKPIRRSQLWDTLALPYITTATTTAAQSKEPELPLAERMPIRFLLVEDNMINQKVTVRILKRLGYHVDIANNGQEAVDPVSRSLYDIIFMDEKMPILDGLEATRKIRQAEAKLAATLSHRSIIIALTANAVSGDREVCLAAGMDDYMRKPIRPDLLRQIIEKGGIESLYLLLWTHQLKRAKLFKQNQK